MNYKTIPNQETTNRTIAALKANGINAVVVNNAAEAKKLVLSMIPAGRAVMTMTSETLRSTGIDEAINSGDTYHSLKRELYSMDRATQSRQMQVLGAAPEYALGSVHAITEQGELIIASNTGSQLPAYAYGSDRVIWVAGAQKIVPTIDEGLKRLREYVLPLESERAHKAYGVAGSNISKLLIINKEVNPERLHLIIVQEVLGF